MTSTGSGSGSATATGTSPTHDVFQPKRPIMGSLVQIKSDTHVTWTGEMPHSYWTDLDTHVTWRPPTFLPDLPHPQQLWFP